MNIDTDALQHILFKIVEEYEQGGIKNLGYIVKQLANLSLVSKEFCESVRKLAFPYLESLIETDMPSDIPWNTIMTKPKSVRVKDLRRASEFLYNDFLTKSKSQLIEYIFQTLEIERPTTISAKILWELKKERDAFIQMPALDDDYWIEAECIIYTLYVMGYPDTPDVGILATVLSKRYKKDVYDYLSRKGIDDIAVLKDRIAELRRHLPKDWDYRNCRYYYLRYCLCAGNIIHCVAHFYNKKYDVS